MSPAHCDEASYTDQLVLCLVLILCISVSLGVYIVRFNAQIDKQRELSPVHLLECGQGRGAFIVDTYGHRSSSDNCYLVEDDS